MNFNENFESVKNFARSTAASAAEKAKNLASIAKANVSIYAEEDKIRKAELELGKLYYRDYAAGGEADAAEYAPWCQKIDESKKLIDELKASIEEARAGDAPKEAPAEPDFVEVVEEAVEEIAPECEITIEPEQPTEE